MGAYHQLGHQSENLVGMEHLEGFRGVILSPVNRSEGELAEDIKGFRSKVPVDVIIDPQLYSPRALRGKLSAHRYFPQDLDTQDLTNDSWWKGITDRLVEEAATIEANGICSPIVVPTKWGDSYFARALENYHLLEDAANSAGLLKAWMTLPISFEAFDDVEEPFRVASLVTRGGAPKRAYLVIQSDTEPRRELLEPGRLSGVLRLVRLLSDAGVKVLVSHCSSDMMLMKAAGAAHCATGKFFNLRRFTKSRFKPDEDEGGGPQKAYWFETSLCAYLRQVDILRLQRERRGDLVGYAESNNHWGRQILTQFANNPSEAWLALSWRQYLEWFVTMEQRLSGEDSLNFVSSLLKRAEKNWEELDDGNVLMEETRNDGRWIRPWRLALADLNKPVS